MNGPTNSVASSPDAAAGLVHLPFVAQVLLLTVFVPAIYYLLVLLGRRLKRQHGVRLGLLYHLFALGVSIYFPALLLGLGRSWSFIHHIGAASVVLGALFLIALVDRYVWELYFRQ